MDPTENQFGCFPCNKCYMCRKFLNITTNFSSFHTNQVFVFSNLITCQVEGLIYIIDCITREVSYVGYTIGKMVIRLSNDKSHIKYCRKTCEITKHFIENDHKLNRSSVKDLEDTLSQHLKVTLIERVEFPEGFSSSQKEELCQTRETYWQNQLKCFTRFGGLNKRNNKKYEKT